MFSEKLHPIPYAGPNKWRALFDPRGAQRYKDVDCSLRGLQIFLILNQEYIWIL